MIIGPFPDWNNLEECVSFCDRMAKGHKKMAPFYIAKAKDSDSYIMGKELECINRGGKVIYSSELGYLNDNQQQEILLRLSIAAVKIYMKFVSQRKFKPIKIKKEIAKTCLIRYANQECETSLDVQQLSSIADEVLINY